MTNLKTFVRDVSERGLGIDTNPTMSFNKTPQEMYQWWAAYVQRAEDRLRRRARMALNEDFYKCQE